MSDTTTEMQGQALDLWFQARWWAEELELLRASEGRYRELSADPKTPTVDLMNARATVESRRANVMLREVVMLSIVTGHVTSLPENG